MSDDMAEIEGWEMQPTGLCARGVRGDALRDIVWPDAFRRAEWFDTMREAMAAE